MIVMRADKLNEEPFTQSPTFLVSKQLVSKQCMRDGIDGTDPA